MGPLAHPIGGLSLIIHTDYNLCRYFCSVELTCLAESRSAWLSKCPVSDGVSFSPQQRLWDATLALCQHPQRTNSSHSRHRQEVWVLSTGTTLGQHGYLARKYFPLGRQPGGCLPPLGARTVHPHIHPQQSTLI